MPDQDQSHNEISGGVYKGLVIQTQEFSGSVTLTEPAPPPAAQFRAPDQWPLARDWDPLSAGTHRARPDDDGDGVPPYIERDADLEIRTRLAAAAEHGGIVLLVGDSTAGKTRTAFEAMRVVLPDHRVLAPSVGNELPPAIETIARSGVKCVLWLDDLDAYLGPGALDQQNLSDLERLGVPVLATMRTRRFEVFNAPGYEDSVSSTDPFVQQITRIGARVLARTDPIDLERTWSDPELERARRQTDARIADAVAHHGPYGVAEYLAAGPALWSEWRRSSRVGGHPRGAALVAAAIDLSRTGLAAPYRQDILVELHEHYLAANGGPALRPESLEDALTWAASVRFGVTSMLIPDADGEWNTFDYLVDQIENLKPAVPVPDFLWPLSLANSITVGDLMSVGVNAAEAATEVSYQVAEEAWGPLVEAGIPGAMYNLGVLLLEVGRGDEAKTWFQKAAEAGEMTAAFNLNILLRREGREDEAQQWNRLAAESGFAPAQYQMGFEFDEAGQTEEAEKWYRLAAEAGEANAACNLGNLLNNTGRPDEAQHWYSLAAEYGDSLAAFNIGLFHTSAGEDEKAEYWYRLAADRGSAEAAHNLGAYYDRIDRVSEAEKWYRRSVDGGFSGAASNLGNLMGKLGRTEEAAEWYRRGAEAGDHDSVLRLGLALAVAEQTGEAEDWLRKAMEMGSAMAASALGELLATAGRFNEAIRCFVMAAKAGLPDAAYNLGAIFAQTGRPSRAKRWYRQAAEAGDAEAMRNLALVLHEEGHEKEAIRWLVMAAEAGEPGARALLRDITSGF
ncbi:tetratricopeptide repeat protein [Streptacidiphilus sp. N1-12]|uniref:Tetratricopeptide repeat protein n=2 Tax=Streptacidiphilus alkalitolerans TaxID=3342712 RepID=A0ABV6VAV6_9ACTN